MKLTASVLILSIVLICSTLKSQNALTQKLDSVYDHETIYLTDSYFVKDEKVRKFGFLSKFIKKEIIEYGSEAAMLEFGQYKRKKIQGGFLTIGGTLINISSLVYMDQLVISAPMIATSFVGMGISLIGIIILSKSYRHLFKAVWMHNKNVIKTKVVEPQ
jgi:hypothetical protein